VLGCIKQAEIRNSFSPGLHTTIFQAEIFAFKVCIMDNKKRATKVGTSIFSPIVKRP